MLKWYVCVCDICVCGENWAKSRRKIGKAIKKMLFYAFDVFMYVPTYVHANVWLGKAGKFMRRRKIRWIRKRGGGRKNNIYSSGVM